MPDASRAVANCGAARHEVAIFRRCRHMLDRSHRKRKASSSLVRSSPTRDRLPDRHAGVRTLHGLEVKSSSKVTLRESQLPSRKFATATDCRPMPAIETSTPRVQRAFTQLSLDPWPAGLSRAAAVLRFEPWEISKRCGLSFARSHDDLDFTDVAMARPARSRTAFALVRHLGCPAAGTELWIQDRVRDTRLGIAGALTSLGLSTRDLVWVRE